jgi:alkanesulfonate monooxygenase SsuD/methylene tetrahydromethanopterin reductase-like flavin-dependent oxidoreductase (luciferase family)
MWRADESPYQGRHYQLVRPLNSPNSVQRPHPPILIGGSGERKTLRLVARYADACNLFDLAGTEFADNITVKLRVLREHCAAAGRNYGEIEKTVSSNFDLGEDRQAGLRDLLAHLRDLAALGIDTVLVAPRHPWDDATLEALASILPDVHAIEPRASLT